MTRMPALFIGHGSPLNTLEFNGFTQAWRKLGGELPKPRALLVVSAHWFFGATAVTAMRKPRTIHDFYGFPPELFAFEYPAAGAPDIVQEVANAVKPTWCGLDRDQWGLDHGTWSVLAHLRPDAGVPVVRFSINALKPLSYHLGLGARPAPLRDRGIMLLGSGNVVHNLARLHWNEPDSAFGWAERFDDAVVEQLQADPSAILKVVEHRDYERAVPTPDHFIPVVYMAGVAAASGEPMEPLVRGYSMGSQPMPSSGEPLGRYLSLLTLKERSCNRLFGMCEFISDIQRTTGMRRCRGPTSEVEGRRVSRTLDIKGKVPPRRPRRQATDEGDSE